MNSNTQTTLLLCGFFPGDATLAAAPLSPGEYHRFVQWLGEQEMSLADLLEPEAERRLTDGIAAHQLNIERLIALLARGGALALAVEKWAQMGIWIACPAEESYPSRLRQRLGKNTPPLLFGVGRPELLSQGGVAIVGSRNVDERAIEFTHQMGQRCAEQNITVISGGAKGVDQAAMVSALEAGGNIVGVLANNLAREAVSSGSRGGIQEGRLTLVSPVSPEARFHAGNAMARNKYIYALADYSLVVNAEHGSGGTWNGALENLKHRWTPMFVRDEVGIPEGNRKLLRRGGFSLDASALEENDLRSWLTARSAGFQSPEETTDKQVSLFGENAAPARHTLSHAADGFHEEPELDWESLQEALLEARTADELSELAGIPLPKMTSWLRDAVKRKFIKRLTDPVRYVISKPEHD